MLFAILCLIPTYEPGPEISLIGADNGQRTEISAVSVPGKDLDGRIMYLRDDAASALADLIEYANRSGFDININYAFRSWWQQKSLFRKSPRLAAEPGFSNHQSGISIDINWTTIKRCEKCSRRKTEFYYWLAKEGPRFGFVNDLPGEPWHWTFTGLPKDNLIAQAD